ncbi:hypothetical protein AV530_017889 [Patagioenas fasciata monilis]|uniref:Uncharacterized protein n=1 Tax=Patagioenas fasciata monilis TaxID=372326 RepID=A0A1V4JVY4_PATFA|nr:hypothetical protein AV530_017889 [Patagioenas fasciata monilis]
MQFPLVTCTRFTGILPPSLEQREQLRRLRLQAQLQEPSLLTDDQRRTRCRPPATARPQHPPSRRIGSRTSRVRLPRGRHRLRRIRAAVITLLRKGLTLAEKYGWKKLVKSPTTGNKIGIFPS